MYIVPWSKFTVSRVFDLNYSMVIGESMIVEDRIIFFSYDQSTSNNSIKCSPRGGIKFEISRIAANSRRCFSSFDTPHIGVISPTILSAKSCTSAVIEMKLILTRVMTTAHCLSSGK